MVNPITITITSISLSVSEKMIDIVAFINVLLPLCRRTLRGESPELAQSLLDKGNYVPRMAQDMWGLGLALLDTMGGAQTQAA